MLFKICRHHQESTLSRSWHRTQDTFICYWEELLRFAFSSSFSTYCWNKVFLTALTEKKTHKRHSKSIVTQGVKTAAGIIQFKHTKGHHLLLLLEAPTHPITARWFWHRATYTAINHSLLCAMSYSTLYSPWPLVWREIGSCEIMSADNGSCWRERNNTGTRENRVRLAAFANLAVRLCTMLSNDIQDQKWGAGDNR